MADLAITATSVVASSDAIIEHHTAGETITAGQPVYLSGGKIYKSDANGTTTQRALRGIAINGGSINQTIAVQTTGSITIGATVAIGTIYVVSGTAGGIAPHSDLLSGMQTIILGVGETTGSLKLNFFNSGVSVP